MESRNKREGWYRGKDYDYINSNWVGQDKKVNLRHRRSRKEWSLAKYRGIHKRTQEWIARVNAEKARGY